MQPDLRLLDNKNLWSRIIFYPSPWVATSWRRVFDYSRNQFHGILTDMDPGTDWVPVREGNRNGYALDFDGVNDWVDFGPRNFSGTDFSVVSWFRILTAGVHFPYSTSSATSAAGIDLLYGPAFVFSQIRSTISGSGLSALVHDFGTTANALAGPICFVQCFSDSQATKTHSIFVNGGNKQSTTYTASVASTQNWSWAKRGTQFFVAGGGGSNANGTCRWLEQIVFRGILTDSEVSLIYRLGPGGLLDQSYKRPTSNVVETSFRNYWLKKSQSLIGGGIK